MEIWETVEIWCVSQSSKAATKLKSFAFSSRASRLRGESPAQDSPRSREEREDFAKKNPFLPAKDFRVSSTDEHGSVFICVHRWIRSLLLVAAGLHCGI